MRTRTAGENDVLNAAFKSIPHTKVEIKNAGGSYVDWFAYLLGVNWGASIDQPIAEARLQLRRDNGPSLSLSPFRGDSTLNIGGAAIDAGRDFKLSPATVAWDTGAQAADYKLLFIGKTADIDFANSAMEILARDQGGTLVKAQIRTASEYRNELGEPLQDVMQSLLDTWAPGVTLSAPVPPGFMVTSIDWGKGSLFEALRTAAGKIGWDVRYVWNPTLAQFSLTLFEPDRTKVIPDWTFAKNRILKVTQLRISDEFVRNYIVVSYLDSVSGHRQSVTASDSVSIARFGEQWMEIEEADDSPISTELEAFALAEAALSDLAWPIAEKQVEIPFFWPVEIGDLIRFTADDIWSDEDIDLAVTGLEHRLGKEARTVLTVRGKPAGFYKSWLKKTTRSVAEIEDALGIYDIKEIQGETTVTWRMRCGYRVDKVWMFEHLDAPIEATDFAVGVSSPDANRMIFYPVNIPAETHYLSLMFQPVDEFGVMGKPWFTSVKPKPNQAPEVQKKPKENGQTGTLWIKVQSRGIAITNVQAQTQIGTLPFSALAAPTRAAGGVSVVNGGILGTDEYEHDVELDSYIQSGILFLLTLATGETVTVASPPFPPNRVPDFVTEPVVLAPNITITGDYRTRSIKVERIGGGTWVRQINNWFAVVDVSALDDAANAGQANNSSALYRMTLRSDATADVDVNTFMDTRDATVIRGTTSDPIWDDVQAVAPAVSSGTMSIKLDSSTPNVGYTGKVWKRAQYAGDPFEAWVDITASLSPALSSPPPTTLTTYTYATGYTRIAKDITKPDVTIEVKAELLNGSSVVVASGLDADNWYTNPPL